jgi:hypothetical protein
MPVTESTGKIMSVTFSFVNLDYTSLVMFNRMPPDRIYHDLIGLVNSIAGVFKQYRGYRIAE